ncbi:MAG TPA: DUF58 domain-containing protein [Polyangia bacterium]|jgi:uncharacterized protein (DUF58 family)|nr:DUF58 domain-containing protein [Polyangia bacterium]
MSAAAPTAASVADPPSARFDERFLRTLETLSVIVKRRFAGLARADRRTRRVGSGIEFADHRAYAAGDDLRYLDWNLYGRVGRLLVRLFEEDEDLSISVLVDSSASMGMGQPRKLDVALQVGAALAYVGLSNLDRVALYPINDTLAGGLPPARGKGHILPLLRFLDGVAPVGRTDLATAVKTFLRQQRRGRRGLVILISDFYDPAGYRQALDLLRYNRFELMVIQISAPDEANPSLRGELTIRDVETGEERELTIAPAVVEAYRRRRTALLRGIEGFCREHAVPCFCITSDTPFDQVVLRLFRAGGVLG